MNAAQPALLSPDAPASANRFQAEEEVRFAVVMYGGVSLAIYINGIAQELLNMVYATAPERPGASTLLRGDAELTGSQAVYRKLGRCLQGLRENDDEVRQLLAATIDANAGERDSAAKLLSERPVTTRLVVDILSGTSAGGINAVFLAKALANRQSIEGLKSLWVTEGDLARLINDDASIHDLEGWNVSEPQASLLNSRRMYRKLLEAFDQMDPAGEQAGEKAGDSPLVSELDLFVTATDVQGLALPVKLADGVVYEKRHRNVFHFRYAGARAGHDRVNDFHKANDPFLAYSARCTSSFPFAFEPMQLADIEEITRNYDRGERHVYHRANPDDPAWQKFYSDYWRLAQIDLESNERKGVSAQSDAGSERDWLTREQKKLQDDFRARSFGDGGYLDNKPFSYATSMLARRRADVPVQRKLIFIEPSPEQQPRSEAFGGRPDFAQNVTAAMLELPGKETIRQDIERVLQRNRLLARISIYTREVDADVARLCRASARRDGEDDRAPCDVRSIRPVRDFAAKSLSEMIELRGVGYGAYHRLRVDAVCSTLAGLISRAAQHDPRSDATLAVKALVEAWRSSHFAPDPQPGGEHEPETRFLVDFDLSYHLRRYAFMSRRINELARLDTKAAGLLETWQDHRESEGKSRLDLGAVLKDKAWRAGFRQGLRELKRNVNDHVMWLAACEEELGRLDAHGNTVLTPCVDKLRMRWVDLERILKVPGTDRVATARTVLAETYAERGAALTELAGIVRARIAKRPRFEAIDPDALPDGLAAARACLAFYYAQYHVYDMIIFPLQYGTGASETSEVEIYRFSPEDATALIDERRDPGNRRKLAGTFLMNFGAFLEKTWRENDILWGRLDGAERLIAALMPVRDETERVLRDAVVREAQTAILAEDLHHGKVNEVRALLARCLAEQAPRLASDPRGERAQLDALLERIDRDKNELPLAMQSVLNACLKERDELWSFYSEAYEVDRRADPENAVRLIARGTHVAARMFEGLAAKYRRNGKPFRWVASLASVFWGMVEVAVPQSIPNLLWHHWMKVVYLLDAGFIAGGIALGQPDVARFGWSALAITIVVHLAVLALGDFVAGKGTARWIRLLKALVAAILLILCTAGVIHLYALAQPLLAR